MVGNITVGTGPDLPIGLALGRTKPRASHCLNATLCVYSSEVLCLCSSEQTKEKKISKRLKRTIADPLG